MATAERQSIVSVSSENPETSHVETHLTNEDTTEPVGSFSSKEDAALSESSEELELAAMQTLDNIVEQVAIIQFRTRINLNILPFLLENFAFDALFKKKNHK
ncbi:unnamed protein product [Gongylonema pulchrum]|uniref:Uncharacterized protein n=1 Tax=Gongylonema pulchrum TaxID=637853 RepID=A0A183DCQ8_9BILA|nr:unnamed protein product [Gongylonema pulchrum]